MSVVDLTPKSEELVSEQLKSGRYGSASEVVEEALRVLVERDAEADDDLLDLDVEYVRAKVQEALDDPRPPIPMEDVFARLRAKLRSAERADGK